MASNKMRCNTQVCHKRRTDFVLQHFGREAGSDRRDRCGTVLLRKDFRLSKII